jgi:hypothetical protein
MSETALDLSNAIRKEYWPGPAALEAHRSKARVKLAWGPLGTAKTTWLCWRAQAIAARAAKAGFSARLLFVRDTYRNLIDSTFQTFKEWFPDGSAAGYVSQSEPVDFKLNVGGRYHDVLFRHGQTEQDASMFLSTEYDFIGLEEIAPAYIPGGKKVSPGISEGVFDMAIGRLSRRADRAAAIRPELCMTCNSPPLTHWASKRIIDKPASYLADPVLNWAHWMFPISDNAHNLDSNYYASLEKAWEGKRQLIARFLRGERIAVFIGSPRFNMNQLDDLKKLAVEPISRGLLKEHQRHVKLERNPEGYVRIWKQPERGKRYCMGADCSEGVEGGDYSAAYVLDCADASIAAAWHGKIEPALFAEELALLGDLYHRATIGVENNPGGHGNIVLLRLRDGGYENIYSHHPAEIRRDSQQNRLGMCTDMRTKPMMIDGIGEYLEALGPKGEHGSINDAELISELQTFGIMENGKTGAQEGAFDDRVIAFAIALLVQQRSGLERIYPSLRR